MVASSRTSNLGNNTGAKNTKGGRYIDTNAPSYEMAADMHVAGAANTAADANLRKITSPNATGTKFSTASPTNSSLEPLLSSGKPRQKM
ncbi:hypothetical protein PHMEG_00018131 [Phytophthora megakarya]|uniref:Uncharacterized protein n=1 Tax=Phytophthora megakarya TaxID=4795 RepID=A0A225VV25_9STRA|nr:hypothetical protein PHMEG_00018131 [Phytophthora megakarya]